MIGNAKTLARLLGFPYFPLTPTFPLARAAGRGAAADEVDDPVRRADPHGRLSAGGGGGPDADVQPDGPGAGDDPAHAVQAAGAAAVGVLLDARLSAASRRPCRVGRRGAPPREGRARPPLPPSSVLLRVLAVDAQARAGGPGGAAGG